MVPFIDVMLVLLIIFMVTAPLIATGVVDLPSVGKSKTLPQIVVEVVVTLDGRAKLKVNGQADAQPVPLAQLATRVTQELRGKKDVAVVISAERKVDYESVVRVMDKLKSGGIDKVGLLVKQGG